MKVKGEGKGMARGYRRANSKGKGEGKEKGTGRVKGKGGRGTIRECKGGAVMVEGKGRGKRTVLWGRGSKQGTRLNRREETGRARGKLKGKRGK